MVQALVCSFNSGTSTLFLWVSVYRCVKWEQWPQQSMVGKMSPSTETARIQQPGFALITLAFMFILYL